MDDPSSEVSGGSAEENPAPAAAGMRMGCGPGGKRFVAARLDMLTSSTALTRPARERWETIDWMRKQVKRACGLHAGRVSARVEAMEFSSALPYGTTPEIHFLLVELQTGLTMANIALSTYDMEKRNRTRANARKAYDAVLRFMPRLDPESSQAREIGRRLERLKWELHLLGEQL